MNSNFNENEIVRFERWNKALKKNVVTEFPVVGGRLRLFHEDLAKADSSQIAGGIDVEIIEHDREYCLVKARVCINGNSFTGTGMASMQRDKLIFPAIMEMAETRAIARALRFAGYGVEYTGAEEMQGVKNFGDDQKPQSSDNKESQVVNDDPPDDHDENVPVEQSKPSLKRQVWNLVTSSNPTVQENYLANAVLEFVADTLAKYDSNDAEMVYGLILENQDLFLNSFKKYIARAVPEIKAPVLVEEEASSECVDKAPDAVAWAGVRTVQEDQAELNKLKKAAVDKMTVDPPPPAIDPLKVARANIYRAMPDGISVAALNGTLKSLVEKNQDIPEGEIYKMILEDIDGFMVLIEEWCRKNNFPPKVEDEETRSDIKAAIADAAFRKSWVRLDLENFNKFIIQNADVFKSSKEEYDMAVAKFDRLKAKSPETENMVFPYLFSQEDVKLSTKESVLVSEDGPELKTMREYSRTFPLLVESICNIDGCVAEKDAERINEEVEKYLTKFEAEKGRPYRED